MDFRDRRAKNNVPEITDLLRYLPMLELFGGKALSIIISSISDPIVNSVKQIGKRMMIIAKNLQEIHLISTIDLFQIS